MAGMIRTFWRSELVNVCLQYLAAGFAITTLATVYVISPQVHETISERASVAWACAAGLLVWYGVGELLGLQKRAQAARYPINFFFVSPSPLTTMAVATILVVGSGTGISTENVGGGAVSGNFQCVQGLELTDPGYPVFSRRELGQAA